MALRPQGSEPGLKALGDSREVRRRAVVLGKIRVREVATRFWLFTFAGFAVFGVAYWQYAEVQLAAAKDAVAQRQRALKIAVGESASPLRAQLEEWIRWLAQADKLADSPVLLEREVALTLLPASPGIYVRLGQKHAIGEKKALRAAISKSGHDGFTSCYFAGNKPRNLAKAKVCRSTDQCGPGEYCGPRSRCVTPVQPFDMRWLNEALTVLEPEWMTGLSVASNEYKVRTFELALAGVSKHQAPIAAQIFERSEYFTAVVDLGEPPVRDKPMPGFGQSAQRNLRASAHLARVGMWRLKDKKLLVAVELAADARLIGGPLSVAETNGAVGQRVRGAAMRQANDCALAGEVQAVLAAKSATPPGLRSAAVPIPGKNVAQSEGQ